MLRLPSILNCILKAITAMLRELNLFGADYFTYTNGVRHLTQITRTLRPERGETNHQFESRCDVFAAQLALTDHTVNLKLDLKDGAYQCATFFLTPTEPQPAPHILPDQRPTYSAT